MEDIYMLSDLLTIQKVRGPQLVGESDEVWCRVTTKNIEVISKVRSSECGFLFFPCL